MADQPNAGRKILGSATILAVLAAIGMAHPRASTDQTAQLSAPIRKAGAITAKFERHDGGRCAFRIFNV
jgi:hypothetical protein